MEKPKLRRQLFWDTDMSQLDYDEHARTIIVRVLERGNMDEWNEIKRYYGHEKIREAVTQARYLSGKVLSFASSLYNIPVTKFRCYTWRQSNPILWNS